MLALFVPCIYFCFVLGATDGCLLGDYALEFPNKGVTDYVHFWGMPRLTQFTVCFWMKSSDSNDGTPFSYAVPGADNELLIAKYNNFTVWIGDEERQLSVSANDGKWHHICASWENRAGSLKFYKDGDLSGSETNFKRGHVVRSGGSLMLGQEQDSFGGGLDSIQSFQGFLSNLNVWNSVVCEETITQMSKDCLSGEGNVHEWSHFKHSVVGAPRLFIPSPCDAKRRNECESNPCLNNGTCTNRVSGYNCSCPPGFVGDRCEIDVDACASNPCMNNGTCSDRAPNGYNCSCAPGFRGAQCEQAVSLMNSAVIGDNALYQSQLQQFLAPAVGGDPEWLLCYRASSHGWAASEFHSRCDGKPDNVVIIKVGQYVFGGYTDLPWESRPSWGSTSNAFIFSLRNKEGLGPFKSMVKSPGQFAIYRNPDYGPIFGAGNDIYIVSNANIINSNSYTHFGQSYTLPSGVQDPNTVLAGTRRFSPDDWEVFYLG